MFDSWNWRNVGRPARSHRRIIRGPVVIGFEQLEGREMMSSGVALTIIPTDPRPLVTMPRPLVGSLDPRADVKVKVPVRAKVEPVARPWLLGGRFRFDRM